MREKKDRFTEMRQIRFAQWCKFFKFSRSKTSLTFYRKTVIHFSTIEPYLTKYPIKSRREKVL